MSFETVVLVLLAQALGALVFWSAIEKQVRREVRRAKVNPFVRYSRVWFWRRGVWPIFLLILFCDLGWTIGRMLAGGYSGTGTGIDAARLELRVGFSMDNPVPLVFIFWLTWMIPAIFRNAHRSGLVAELEMPRTSPQEVLIPLLWRIAAPIAQVAAIKSLPLILLFPERHELLPWLPVLAVRQALFSVAAVAFLFCSCNHGLGLMRTAALGIVGSFVLHLPMIPLIVLSHASPRAGLPALWIAQIIIFYVLGRLFYVSFQRTAREARTPGRLEYAGGWKATVAE